jgi:Ferritin-like domain
MTRRQIVSVALALGGLGAAGSTAASLLTATRSEAADHVPTDSDLLYGLLAIELLVVAVYAQVIDSGLLSAGAQRVARQLLAHERAHVRVLTAELRKLGVAPPVSPASTSVTDKALADRHVSSGVAKLQNEQECLRLLLDVESVAEGSYYTAMSKLEDPGLLRTAAAIMANEGQHSTALSELLHPGDISQAVPYAFVEGTY